MKKILVFLGIYLTVFVLFFPVFGSYFSQDDFFHFKIGLTDGSFQGFINLFSFSSFTERGYTFYRPISREGLYHIYYSIFNLDPTAFHLLSFFLHFVDIFLVFIFIKRLFKDERVALFASLLFGISAINISVFYYTAGGIQTSLTTLFILSTLLLYYNFLVTKKLISLFFSSIPFVFAIGSHEIGGITVALMVVLTWVKTRKLSELLKKVSYLTPFVLTTLIYMYLDMVVIGFLEAGTEYKPNFSLLTLFNTLSWYIVWAFGVPEMLVDFVKPGFELNPSLMRYWGDYFSIIFICFLTSLFFLAPMSVYLLYKQKIIKKEVVFLGIWFLLTLFPVMFLPQHKFTYYLVPGFPAFASILGFILFYSWDYSNFFKVPVVGVILCLLVLSITSIKLEENLYWAASRGKIAGRIINQIKLEHSVLPSNSAIYILNDPTYPYIAKDWGGTSKQAKYILNDQDAIQLLYNDLSLKTFYEDNGGIPENFPKDRVYSIVARIN